MPERLIRSVGQWATVLRDVVRGAAGANAYGQYLEHLSRQHPGREPMSRAEFFREDTVARWSGVRRCC